MKKIVFLIVLLLAVGWSVGFAAQSRESFTMAAADLKVLKIDCGAGYLKIQGVDGLQQIEVSAVLDVEDVADNELADFKKEFVTLKLEKNSGRAELTAKIENDFSLSTLFSGSPDARIDLDVRVPRGLALAIDDGSGDILIRDCDGNLELEDGSGDIHLTNIKGQVDIEDGSGEITLAKIGGALKIEDGSGDIELEDAGNDVTIDDGSGDMRLQRVLGSVTVDDGSGDIEIDGVEKDVTIEEAGSGGVSIHNVKGKVRE
ncbi:MAG: DUF4097 family beta strand repeat-containing protein [Candidatus Aminicenantes bacterium]|nr:DUF4097 family beta strand repeat-containing protein [Candidatus Aminicenantes bacterium]